MCFIMGHVGLFAGFLSLLHTTVALECFTCSNVTSLSECHTTVFCGIEEKCFTNLKDNPGNSVFSLGCRPESQCVQPSAGIIGREVSSSSLNFADPAVDCDQCCSVNYCNKQLCSRAHSTGSGTDACQDSPGFNCELVSATFNICTDIHHAKSVCRKWCGLCDLVDGGWSSWGEWSLCERTCGRSQRIRLRECTDPAPAHGGLECPGNRAEFDNCTGVPCPIPGEWSTWTSWGACAVSCGLGLAARTRMCNNPYPNYGGDHCFGSPSEYKACFTHGCQDGAWSDWQAWGACSVTCNGGIRSRSRTCDNPAPSLFGRSCPGDSKEYSSCSTTTCQAPSGTQPAIFFTVTTPTGYLFQENVPIFSVVVVNQGHAYDQRTGQFVTPVAGMYEFYVAFISKNATTQCFVRQNRNIKVYALTNGGDSGWQSASASAFLHCDVGDHVDLSCGGWQYVDHNASTMFTGALMRAD